MLLRYDQLHLLIHVHYSARFLERALSVFKIKFLSDLLKCIHVSHFLRNLYVQVLGIVLACCLATWVRRNQWTAVPTYAPSAPSAYRYG
jgi:hypothetical protein